MKQNNRKIACMLAVGAMMLPATILSASAAPAVSVQSVQQAAKVFGTVTDGKEPVIGASIRVKNGNQGTITDMDGNFKLDVAPGTELLISYVGYKDVTVKAAANMNIVL